MASVSASATAVRAVAQAVSAAPFASAAAVAATLVACPAMKAHSISSDSSQAPAAIQRSFGVTARPTNAPITPSPPGAVASARR